MGAKEGSIHAPEIQPKGLKDENGRQSISGIDQRSGHFG